MTLNQTNTPEGYVFCTNFNSDSHSFYHRNTIVVTLTFAGYEYKS